MEKEKFGELRSALGKDGIKDFGNNILKSVEELGLGILSKNDFEAFLFHQLTLSIDKNKIKTNFDWQRILKVTPTKLRNLQNVRSARFLDLSLSNSDNWNLLLKELKNSKVEVSELKKGTIRFYINDVHVFKFIENFVFTSQGSSVDYSFNRNQVVIKFSVFLNLLDGIEQNYAKIKKVSLDKNNLLSVLSKNEDVKKLNDQLNSIDELWGNFKEKIKEKTFEQIADETIRKIITVGVQHLRSKLEI